jgi:small subunit ribosomal protein S6
LFLAYFSGDKKNMPLYETTFIARQDISTHDVDKLIDNFSKIVSDNGGKIVKTEYWGLRNLAYLVKKSRKGHYAMLGIDSPYAAVKEMERLMGLNEDVLRSLTIRVEKLSQEPSPMMNTRSSQDEVEEVVSNDNSDTE